eukprot:TRINITY_DN6559_c0_g1_i3.p1 TRINITY_DN6559_c0_g1~~TRINITY_DN6559_c0_g1_i3.p1  ORF type:complete len:286 (-),score=57.36 TRINITY_DN6559_c0_g1_i3:728-1585(-)
MVLVIASLILFSNADAIGYAASDGAECLDGIRNKASEGNQVHRHLYCPAALTTAISSFWLLGVAISILQAPMRVLIADQIPSAYHMQANLWGSCMWACGSTLGHLLAALDLLSWLPFFASPVRAVFSFAALFVLIFVMISLQSITSDEVKPEHHTVDEEAKQKPDSHVPVDEEAKEKPDSHVPVDEEAKEKSDEFESLLPNTQKNPIPYAPEEKGFWASIVHAYRVFPPSLYPTFAVQFCTWFCFFFVVTFAASWVGQYVYEEYLVLLGVHPPAKLSNKVLLQPI